MNTSRYILLLFLDNIFHLDVHYVCYTMLVQRFEPQGRRFTNFHYYYLLLIEEYLVSYVFAVFDRERYKLQALGYDILPWRNVPEGDGRSVGAIGS